MWLMSSVFNTVRLWLENHYLEEDSKLLDRFEDFANLLLSNGSPTMSKQLGAIVQRRVGLHLALRQF